MSGFSTEVHPLRKSTLLKKQLDTAIATSLRGSGVINIVKMIEDHNKHCEASHQVDLAGYDAVRRLCSQLEQEEAMHAAQPSQAHSAGNADGDGDGDDEDSTSYSFISQSRGKRVKTSSSLSTGSLSGLGRPRRDSNDSDITLPYDIKEDEDMLSAPPPSASSSSSSSSSSPLQMPAWSQAISPLPPRATAASSLRADNNIGMLPAPSFPRVMDLFNASQAMFLPSPLRLKNRCLFSSGKRSADGEAKALAVNSNRFSAAEEKQKAEAVKVLASLRLNAAAAASKVVDKPKPKPIVLDEVEEEAPQPKSKPKPIVLDEVEKEAPQPIVLDGDEEEEEKKEAAVPAAAVPAAAVPAAAVPAAAVPAKKKAWCTVCPQICNRTIEQCRANYFPDAVAGKNGHQYPQDYYIAFIDDNKDKPACVYVAEDGSYNVLLLSTRFDARSRATGRQEQRNSCDSVPVPIDVTNRFNIKYQVGTFGVKPSDGSLSMSCLKEIRDQYDRHFKSGMNFVQHVHSLPAWFHAAAAPAAAAPAAAAPVAAAPVAAPVAAAPVVAAPVVAAPVAAATPVAEQS